MPRVFFGPSLPDRNLELHVVIRVLLTPAWRATAEDTFAARDPIGERPARDRVDGQRHADVRQAIGEPPFLGGVQAEGLEVAEQGEALSQPAPDPDNAKIPPTSRENNRSPRAGGSSARRDTATSGRGKL